jgi:hypothetical protein
MSTRRQLIQDDDAEYFVPLKEPGYIDWSARGGCGGDGGNGGDEADGGYAAEGYNVLGGGGTYYVQMQQPTPAVLSPR